MKEISIDTDTDDKYLGSMFLLPPIPLYAEIHYTLPFFFSLLKKRQPEIVADAPFRVDPSPDIPVLCLIKDADRYPILLQAIRINTRYPSNRVEETVITLNESITTPFWWRIFPISPREVGALTMDVIFHVKCQEKYLTIHNDNYFATSHRPLSVYKSETPLPSLPNWYYGEPHIHTTYTNDQIEFGSPIKASVYLAKVLGLTWIAVTDHSYEFDTLASSHLSATGSNPLSWQAMQQEIELINCEETGCVVLSGEEISCGSNGRNVHLLAYGISDYVPGAGDGAKQGLKTDPDLTVAEALHHIALQRGVAYASHPLELPPLSQRLILRRGAWSIDDLEKDELTGWLFWNGESSPGLVKGEHLWKVTLLKGKRCFLAGGNDAHGNFNRFRQVRIPFVALIEANKQLFGNVKTCIYTERPLSVASILDALREGRSTMTDGPFLICEVIIDGRVTGIGGTASGNRGIVRIYGETTEEFGKFQEIVVYRGDLTTQHETVALRMQDKGYECEKTMEFTIHRPIYFRAEGRTETGKRCLTNPIWVTL